MRTSTSVLRCTAPIAGAALCAIVAGCGAAPGSAPQPTPSTSAGAAVGTDPFSLRVGDCIEDDLTATDVLRIPVVDCDTAHTAEAYHSERLPDGAYPGLEVVKSLAVETCLERFEGFAGIGYDESQQLDFAWYYPTEGSWSSGDREILCLMMRIDPASGETLPTTGSLRGFGR